ncbi:hypothetical protein [Oscillatoria salina]|uniref:hypothetical protein n=1 Tax=Oscillatoria salina TaxID=331517 RepID=UPI0013BAC30A|nr:hypothetical protein [Oscillatoria salina]MBZ8179801.1 hypothetical protein [Oscillatoria salina IIICB1]MEC4893030.1 hypothetical protein [Oscillatoria sp. PMC 1050.18]NET87688.1 hypothetical protein [Kamptonema sp. SIO1D9]
MTDDDLKQLIASNAKSIQALTTSLNELKQEWQKDREEWQKDRKQIYQWMSRLSASQANFWETQADYYRRLEDVEDRQAIMLEILNRVTKKDEDES